MKSLVATAGALLLCSAPLAAQERIGPYVGLSSSLLEGGESALGGTVLLRYPMFRSGAVEFSARPFVTFAASPEDGIAVNGGATVTADFVMNERNVYGGIGYGVLPDESLTPQLILNVGAETALSPRTVAFTDVKFPTQSTGMSPVYTVGVGYRF